MPDLERYTGLPPKPEFGDRFRSLFAEWAWPIYDLVEFLGCDDRTAYLIADGALIPSEFTVARLAKHLGVTVRYLYGDPDAEKYPPEVTAAKAGLRRYVLAREREFGNMPTLSPRVREVLKFLIKAAPDYYTLDFLGRWMRHNENYVHLVLRGESANEHVMWRVALLTGIPLRWFWNPEPDLRKDETLPDMTWPPKRSGVMMPPIMSD